MLAIFMICFLGYGIHVGNALSWWDYDHTAQHHQKHQEWNGTCKDGKRQSPIDIQTRYTKNVSASLRLILNGYDKHLAAQLENNGHTVELTFKDGPDKDIWVKDGEVTNAAQSTKSMERHFQWKCT